MTTVCLVAEYDICLRLAKKRAKQASPRKLPLPASQPPPRTAPHEVSLLPEAALPMQTLPAKAHPGDLDNNLGGSKEHSSAHPVRVEERLPASNVFGPGRVPMERLDTVPITDVPSPKPTVRRTSRSFTFTELVILNLGVAALFALLLVAVGIAYRVAEKPAVFAEPLSVTMNKMSLLIGERVATPTSSPPALAAASALRISLKAHKAAQANAAIAYAETATTEGPAGEPTATSPPATATLAPSTQKPIPVTAEPTPPPTAEALLQPTATFLLPQPSPTPVPPAATQTLVPSRDAAAASQLAEVPAAGASPPTRITIPSIGLDVPVRPVGTISYEVGGETRLMWDTLPDAAAFHETSAYPGLPGNTVINGHRDIGAAVFRALGEVQVGDAIQVYVSEEVGYVYQVEEILVVPHANASPEQHAENRKLLGYFPEVRLTLITCEPLGSATHRLVVIARPPATQP